jgi:hypothetical protein
MLVASSPRGLYFVDEAASSSRRGTVAKPAGLLGLHRWPAHALGQRCLGREVDGVEARGDRTDEVDRLLSLAAGTGVGRDKFAAVKPTAPVWAC